jgi:hypothetical protein
MKIDTAHSGSESVQIHDMTEQLTHCITPKSYIHHGTFDFRLEEVKKVFLF